MLIGICGGTWLLSDGQNGSLIDANPRYAAGICAGKQSVANYLVEEHGFEQVSLKEASAIDATRESSSDKLRHFASFERLLDFVTQRWNKHWVTVDLCEETVLDALLRRPFFLLVSIDAPVSLRWKRYKER